MRRGQAPRALLASLPPRPQDEHPGEGQEGGAGEEVEGGLVEVEVPAYTTAVLSVPVVAAGLVYAAIVQRGLTSFPPTERQFFNFAETLPVCIYPAPPNCVRTPQHVPVPMSP
jgi:hypothetical protein